MARKKVDLTNPFAKTEPIEETGEQEDARPIQLGPSRNVGVNLHDGELEEIQKIANRLGIARHRLLQFAIRYFLKEYRAGRIDLSRWQKTEVKTTLEDPD
jgi:hypothetical protein